MQGYAQIIDVDINRIGSVKGNELASSSVDHEFEHRWGRAKDYEIGICCFSSKHATLRRKSKDWLVRKQLCPNEATCLSAECCFSELAL
jgi:hypothetical protein